MIFHYCGNDESCFALMRLILVKYQIKDKIMKKNLLLLIFLTFFLHLLVFAGCSKSSSSNQQEQIIRNELQYLNDVQEVSWFEVDDNNVYIGFSTKSYDLTLILRGAALRANAAIDFGVHVWAVKAANKGWRPGDGPYYGEVTARYGKIE